MSTVAVIFTILLFAGAGFGLYSWAKTVEDEERPHHEAVKRATALLADRDMLYRSVWGDTDIPAIIDQELRHLPPEAKKVIEALDRSLRATCRLDEPSTEDPERYSPRKVKVNEEQRAFFEARKQAGTTLEYPTVEVTVSQAELRELARSTARYGDHRLKNAYIAFFRAVLSGIRAQLPKHAFAGPQQSTLTLSSPFAIDVELLRASCGLALFELDRLLLERHSPALDGYPFQNAASVLSLLKFPISIPQDARIRHHWLIGGSGHGKTQTIQHIIAEDIPHILNGERTVIVIDNQKQLVPRIAHLKVWTDHPERLTHIVPWEVKYPIALNLFAKNAPDDPQAAYELMTNLKETYRFIINSLLKDAELTGKQGLPFDALLMLMMKIPNATMTTYLELLTDEGFDEHRKYIQSLEGVARNFFERDYITGGKNDQYRTTREEVRRRLQQLLLDPLYQGMFCQPELKLNLFGDMQAGKMILVDTNKDVMGETESPVVGALFLGLVYQAIMRRDPDGKNTPCYIILDECHELFKHTGSMLESILEQARKRNVGLLLAHQNLDQLNEARGLSGSISANTAIKMAGGVEEDAKPLADTFNWKAQELRKLEQGQFATVVRGLTDRALIFDTNRGLMERMDTMSEPEWAAMRAEMRKRYSVSATAAKPETASTDNDPTKAAPW